MENLFNNAQYQKRLMMHIVSDTEDNCTSSTNSDNQALVVQKVGDIEHMQLYSSNSGDNTDAVMIGDKSVDALGSISDENISAALGKGFSGLAKDILDIMREAIWQYKQATKNDPTIPSEPIAPTTPITPSEPDDTESDPNPDWSNDIVDVSGVQSTGSSYHNWFGSKPTVLRLNNPFTGTEYQYQISSTTGQSQEADFKFLENGRLVVKGDNLKIVAKSGQKDDIILLGNHNEVYTGDEDDTVRVGLVVDNNLEDYYLKYGLAESRYFDLENGDNAYTAVGNKVDTGDGNDYVTMFGDNYFVNMGSGSKDKFLSLTNDIETENITKAENITSQYNIENIDSIDYLDGHVLQGSDGDCRLLSVINSFCGNTNEGNIKDALGVTFTPTSNGSSVLVTFNRYDVSKYGGKNYAPVSESDLANFEGAYGDIDTILIDIALNKLISRNTEYESYAEQFKNNDSDYADYTFDTCVEDATYNTLARYLTGSSEITYLSNYSAWQIYEDSYLTKNRFIDCWHKYLSGEISNIGLGIKETDYSLGIIGGHAYSIKNVDDVNGYIELINPWDDSDVLKISLDKLFNEYTIDLVIYGADLYNQKMIMPNGGYSVTLTEGNTSVSPVQINRINSNSSKTKQKTTSSVSDNMLKKTDDSQTSNIQKEIKSIEDNINKANAIFATKKTSWELFS